MIDTAQYIRAEIAEIKTILSEGERALLRQRSELQAVYKSLANQNTRYLELQSSLGRLRDAIVQRQALDSKC